MKLDTHQAVARKAITARNTKSVQIKARAGSGKTRLLVAAYVHLVKKFKVHPNRIVVTTFSKQAATEIRYRIERELGKSLPKYAPVGTFHSLCLRWLRDNDPISWDMDHCIDTAGFQAAVPSKMNLIWSVMGWGKILGTEHEGLDLDSEEDPGDYLNAIGKLRGAGYTPESPGSAAAAMELAPALPELHKVWSLFEEAKIGVGGFDFTDILEEAERRLGKSLRPGNHWPVAVIVDESQDSNALQYKLAFKLAKQGKVVAVGDVWQAIYSFRGANPELFETFGEDYNAHVLELPTNYRSGTKIVQLSERICGERVYARPGAPRGKVKAIGVGPEGEAVKVSEEGSAISAHIAKLVRKGRKPGEIAVLLRTNAYGAPVEIGLMRLKIPVQVIGRSFWKRREAQTFAAYVQLLHKPTVNALAFIMNRPKRYLPKALAPAIMREFHALGGKPRHLAPAIRCTTGTKRMFGRQIEAKATMATWFEEAVRVPWNLQAERVGRLLAPNEAASPEARERVEQSLEVLVEMAQDVRYPARFSVMFDEATKNAERRERDPNAVIVTTVHSAKGLEWPVVITSASADRFPIAKAVGRDAQLRAALNSVDGASPEVLAALKEEQRLFYVACTRAETELYIVHGLPSVFVSEFIHRKRILP